MYIPSKVPVPTAPYVLMQARLVKSCCKPSRKHACAALITSDKMLHVHDYVGSSSSSSSSSSMAIPFRIQSANLLPCLAFKHCAVFRLTATRLLGVAFGHFG